MEHRYKRILVLGAGSAGFLTALTYKKAIPGVQVTILRSPNIPVIGVGESTTPAIPNFLHNTLELGYVDFVKNVDPIWKIGNRFIWGDPSRPFFDYTFEVSMLNKYPYMRKCVMYYLLEGSMNDFCRVSSMMELHRSPFFANPQGGVGIVNNYGYHIDNMKFLKYLEMKAVEREIEIVEGDLKDVKQAPNGDITSLVLDDGRTIEADFYADCSGFRGELIDKVYKVPQKDYSDSLFCDRAAIGSWDRDTAIEPFTTSETMENGWCWRIELQERITRGYVFSSRFASDDEAVAELKLKNPKIQDDIRVIKFPSFRREKYWVNNCVAIGNAAGFVEPIEATALHCITEQLRFSSKALLDSLGDVPERMIEEENHRFRVMWDDVRDFIAFHYKWNYHSESEFWKHCQNETPLGDAEEFYNYYVEAGPSMLSNYLVSSQSIFGFEGYMNILLGQKVKTNHPPKLFDEDREDWERYRSQMRELASSNYTTEQVVAMLKNPNFQWPFIPKQPLLI